MKKSVLLAAILLLAVALLAPWSGASAATDGYYNLSETPTSWDGTDGSSLNPVSPDYDYAYGDDASITYNLPWSFAFYGQSFNKITADSNGNIWFSATDAAYTVNLANTGRGPVIAAWNKDKQRGRS